jgi:hypothetical protein
VRNMHGGGENDVTNRGEDAATRGPHLSTPHSRVPSIANASAPPARAKWPRLATSHALRACPARCRDRRRDAISLPVTATRAQCTPTPTTAQGEPRRSTAEPTVGFVSVTATKSTGVAETPFPRLDGWLPPSLRFMSPEMIYNRNISR